MPTEYPITCEGFADAIQDLVNELEAAAARLRMLWILEHFGQMVAPWQFPSAPGNDEDLQVYIDWAESIQKDESCPCFTEMQG